MNKRFKTGEIVDDYRIEGFLGAGGMGEVYLGLHRRLQRHVAIKVFNLSLLDSSLAIRFQNEARLQSGLHHPNIAALYDFKEIGRRLFIFMEYVDGESLDELIKKKFFSVDESLLVFNSIVEAVSFVHSSGVIHRDLKSQNIKLTSEGVPKLLDFGIAKDSRSSKLTQTGGIIGTPYYISPEQLNGAKESPQTDVWSMGVLLYEMLTGEMPFQSDNIVGLCTKINQGEYTPIQTKNSAVPNRVARIAEKCLQVDLAKRYQGSTDLSADIAHVLKKQYGVSASSSDAIRRLFLPAEDNSLFEYKQNKAPTPPALIFGMAGLTGVFLVIALLSFVAIWTFSGSGKEPTIKRPLAAKTPVPESTPQQIEVIPTVKPNIKPQSSSETLKPSINTGTGNRDVKKVTIDVFQGGADVLRKGQIIGKTPYQFSGSDGETVRLTLQREGYEDREIEIELSSRKKFYTYSLKKKD